MVSVRCARPNGFRWLPYPIQRNVDGHDCGAELEYAYGGADDKCNHFAGTAQRAVAATVGSELDGWRIYPVDCL